MSGPKVIVVGAGIAGLAAARRLHERGAEVTLLEAAERAGGVASGEARDGFDLAAAPRLVCARDQQLLALLADAGLAEATLPLRPLAIAQLHAGAVQRVDRLGPRDFPRVPGIPWRERRRLARLDRLLERFADLLDPSALERATRLDDRSAADFVRLYVGRHALANWAEPLLGSELLADAAETSRVLLMLHAHERRFAPVGLLRGAAEALAVALAQGAELRCGNPVTEVAPSGVGLRIEAGSARVEADACVFAIAAAAALRVAAPLLTGAERDLLARLRSAPAFVLSVALTRSLRGRAMWVRVPSAERLPLATVLLEPSGERAPAPAGCELATLVARPDFALAHQGAPGDAVEKALLDAFVRILPGAESAIRFTRLWRHREGAPRFDVGCYRDVASFRSVQRDLRERGRRLYFAGAQWLAPTLAGAVASGLRAADDVIADLGI